LDASPTWTDGTCALRPNDRDAVCWGFRNCGYFDDEQFGVFPGPWKEFIAGGTANCGVKAEDNTVRCFNREGTFANPNQEIRERPEKDAPVGPVKQVKQFGYGFVALMQDGSLYAWGGPRLELEGHPVPEGPFTSFDVAWYGYVGCALRTEDNMAVCFGRFAERVEVPDEPLSSIYVQGYHPRAIACGVTLAGKLKCWGGSGATTFDEVF